MPDPKTDLTRPNYPHIPKFVLLLFFGYVVIWYLQIGYRRPALGAIRIEFLWAIGLSVFAFIYTKADNYRNPLTPYLILYFIVIVIQIPFSYNPEYSWNIFVDRIVKFAFMAWFIITFIKRPKGLLFFLFTILFVCLKMGQEGVVGQISGSLVWQNQGVMRLHGSTPLYMHPNSFSGMAVGTLPFIFFFYPIANKIFKGLLIIQLIFSINIIVFTGSRTGWVATIFLLVTIVAKSKKKFKAFAIFLFVIVIAAQYFPADYKERFESIFTQEEAEGSSSEKRIVILKDALYVFLRNPFGIGVGAFPSIRSDLFGRTQDTHNLYLEIATNIGIQGVIVFFLLIYKQLLILRDIEFWANYRLDNYSNKYEKGNKNEKKDVSLYYDLKVICASSRSIYYYIMVRLYLGLFGMDLYEIYWWFTCGVTIALYNIKLNIMRTSEGDVKKRSSKRSWSSLKTPIRQ